MKLPRQFVSFSIACCASAVAVATEESPEQDDYNACVQDVARILSDETSASVIYGWDKATGEFVVIVDTNISRMNLSGTTEAKLIGLENLIRRTSVKPGDSLVRLTCGIDPSVK